MAKNVGFYKIIFFKCLFSIGSTALQYVYAVGRGRNVIEREVTIIILRRMSLGWLQCMMNKMRKYVFTFITTKIEVTMTIIYLDRGHIC